MIKQGTLDIGCGKYSYSLEKDPVVCWQKNWENHAIYSISYTKGWLDNGGGAFKKYIDENCNTLLPNLEDWTVKETPTNTTALFLLTDIDNACVEQGIKIAGGPEMSCIFQDFYAVVRLP
jgi:hypothetical protein